MRWILPATLTFTLLGGCTTNPITGREQMVAVPAVQAHADIGFALSSSARRLAESEPCGEACIEQNRRFESQVKRMAADLDKAARGMSPETFERIESFQVGVDPDLGISTGSSARGRISIGKGIAALEPDESVTAFLIAREMAHVIARHDEEDSGARIVFSALTTLLPFTLIARIIASTLGSGALMGSWAEQQRREADEIAVALLVRAGRSPGDVARALNGGLRKDLLPEGDWAKRYLESAERVAAAATSEPKRADFDEWLMHESQRSIERFALCARESSAVEPFETAAARRRECSGSA
jgi:Zn-dependent protease with chaperone function